jgi:negative regulator of flagellin synthesis FlgM
MKIWGDIPKVFGIYGKNKKVAGVDKKSGIPSKKDVVSISNQAKDFQTVKKALKEVPDVREDKVRELNERFYSGKYDVKGSDVADRIVKSMLDKKV